MTITTDQTTAPTPGQEAAAKRQKNIGHDNFGTSPARQAAALVWAGAEVAAELRDNTHALTGNGDTLAVIADALARQAAAAERTAAAAERTASLTQVQAMLSFYNTDERVFPAGVRDQFKTALGIQNAATAPAPAAPRTTPAVTPAPHVTPPAQTAVAPVDVDEFV